MDTSYFVSSVNLTDKKMMMLRVTISGATAVFNITDGNNSLSISWRVFVLQENPEGSKELPRDPHYLDPR